MLSVSFDSKAMARKAKKVESVLVRANVQALNRTASGAKTDSAKVVKEEQLNIRAGDIKRLMSVLKANKNKPVSKLVTYGKTVPIINAGARQTKKGVTVKVKKSGSRRLIKSSFIATMPSKKDPDNGHKGVFRRTGRLTNTGKKQIVEIFTTTVTQAMRGSSVAKANLLSVKNRYRKEYKASKKHLMSKVK